MQTKRFGIRTRLCCLLAMLCIPALSAAQDRSGISTYAITNARIVQVSGPTLERGTVVIRNGLIQSVGSNITAPADARIIDGTGLTVYPGLIDTYSSFGIPAPAPAPSATPAGRSAQSTAAQTTSFASPNSSQPPGLQPELLASDIIKPGGDQIEAAQNAGITTALSGPRDGIFMGQAALINLSGDTPQQMIVKSPVALFVGFTPLRTGGYPNSLMGVFASIRQMLLDAQRYREAVQIYQRSPRGIRRPEQDKSLEALQPVIQGQMPVIMLANSEREIIRALDLAQEFKLKAMIAGGLESWKVAARLRSQNVPVLLSLNFPRRTTLQLPEADEESIRVLRSRVDAPKTPGKLATAGVKFAFESGAMANMADFSGNLQKAVDAGLRRDDAIRALTLNAADILGASDRIGSIEPGKIANLTVTRGILPDKNTKLAYLFIDGQQISLKPAESSRSTTAASPASGSWSVKVGFGTTDVAISMNLQQEGENLRGTIQGDFGSADITNGHISPDGQFSFTAAVTLNIENKQTTEAAFAGRITGNQMNGTVQIVGHSPGTLTGSKPQ